MKNGFSFVKLAMFAQLHRQEGWQHGVWELLHQLDAVLLKHYTKAIWHLSDSLIHPPVTNKLSRKLNQNTFSQECSQDVGLQGELFQMLIISGLYNNLNTQYKLLVGSHINSSGFSSSLC